MGEIAIEGGKTEWAEQLLDAVAKAMAKSAQRSGWLRGAKAVGPVLRLLEGNEVARQARKEAQHSLIALLPPQTGIWNVQRHLARAVGEAFLALAPLSQDTVNLLWQDVYGPGRQGEGRRSLRLDLAGEPGIARRLLDAPGILESEYGARWLWEVARSPKIEAEALIGAAGRIYKTEDIERLHAVVGALSTLGTAYAARRLGDWLVREAKRSEGKQLDGKRVDQVADGLS